MATVSGTVKDSTGAFASRMVRAYRRSDGAFAGQTVSNATTGAYSITTLDGTPHFAVVHDGAVWDPYWNNVVLAMHMDDTGLTDEKGHAVTLYGVARSSVQSKFGGYSAYFEGVDANNGRIEIADSADWNYPGAFTIEFFIRPVTIKSTISYLYTQGSLAVSTCGGVRIDLAATTGIISVLGSTNGTSWLFTSGLDSTTALSTSAFTHVALSDDGTTCRLFINGVNEASRPTWAKPDLPHPLMIGGAWGSLDRELNGYIDDLRITKGVGRYTANFTPPSSAFLSGPSTPTENALILDSITPL